MMKRPIPRIHEVGGRQFRAPVAQTFSRLTSLSIPSVLSGRVFRAGMLSIALLVFAAPAWASGSRRAWPAWRCSYTMPQTGWRWIEERFGPDHVFSITDEQGRMFTLTVKRMPAGAHFHNRFLKEFEEDQLRDWKAFRVVSRKLTFRGVPAYEITLWLTEDDRPCVARVFAHDGFFYQVILVAADGEMASVSDIDQIAEGFSLLSPPAREQPDIASAYDSARRREWLLLGVWALGVLGVVVAAVFKRRRQRTIPSRFARGVSLLLLAVFALAYVAAVWALMACGDPYHEGHSPGTWWVRLAFAVVLPTAVFVIQHLRPSWPPWRSVDLLLLCAPYLFLFRAQDPAGGAQALGYGGLYAVSVYFFVRLLTAAFRLVRPGPKPARAANAVPWALAALVLFHVIAICELSPEDSCRSVMISGRHILKTGNLPYGHWESGQTPYGPVCYLTYVPAIASWPDGDTAVKVMMVLLDVASVLLVFAVGRSLAGKRAGALAAMLFAASPYVLGDITAGCHVTSHVVAVPFVLLALLLVRWPAAAGASLILGAATMYYPAFALPLWLGYYVRAGRRQALQFVGGTAAAVMIVLAVTFFLTQPPGPEQDRLSTLFQGTWGVQEGSAPGQTGFGPDSIWGQFSWAQPLKKPVFIAYLVFCAALPFLPLRNGRYSLVSLTGAVFVGTQLWKSHTPGLYVNWYLPLLILALVCRDRGDQEPAALPAPA